MGGVQFVSVHRSQPSVGGARLVQEMTVVGQQSDPDVVYVAQTYDRSLDIHNFEGLYGNYADAHSASGPKGRPLQIAIREAK